MNKAQIQRFLDRSAVAASLLCLIHCLIVPLLLVSVPVISSTVLNDEAFHEVLLIFILPTSLIALFIGCRRHRDIVVLALGALGLLTLLGVAYFGHDLLGETGEKAASVMGGITLGIAHLRNYALCREKECEPDGI